MVLPSPCAGQRFRDSSVFADKATILKHFPPFCDPTREPAFIGRRCALPAKPIVPALLLQRHPIFNQKWQTPTSTLMRSVVGCDPDRQAGSGLPQIKCSTTSGITKKCLFSELSVKTLENAAFLAHTASLSPGLVGALRGGGGCLYRNYFKKSVQWSCKKLVQDQEDPSDLGSAIWE